MKSNTVSCGEHAVRILFDDDGALRWVNLQDLCRALGREELFDRKEAVRLCSSSTRIAFRKKGREMWAVSPYDVYRLMRPLRRENALAARRCDQVEQWLNGLLEEAALAVARKAAPAGGEDVVFNYHEHPISFRAANGRLMVNTTQMARSFGILPAEILRKADFMRYRRHLVERGVSESLDSQLFTTRGRGQGATWMEEPLAMEFARHLSPEFSLWCNTRIEELITCGYATLEGSSRGEKVVDAPLPAPQSLDEAARLIAAQRHELHRQQAQIDADRHKVDFYDNLIEGRDFFSTTWIAQEIGISPMMLHLFLSEQGVCKYEHRQWVAFTPYRAWQIEVPYFQNDFRTGRMRPAGMRMRWSHTGREEILGLWRRQGAPLPRAAQRTPREEDSAERLTEGVDYFTSAQVARRLGISCIRLHRFLQQRGICRPEKTQWVALGPYASWQVDIPYRRTMPRTGKRWSFGRRRRWTKLGAERIEALWREQPAEGSTKSPSPHPRRTYPQKTLTEGADYFTPAQVAAELGIPVVRLNRWLRDEGICRFERRQWEVLEPYAPWQVDVPYYWTNPRTGKRWAFALRKYWTPQGRAEILERWNRRQEAPKDHE